MRIRDRVLYGDLNCQLIRFGNQEHPLPGITSTASREVFVRQLIDGTRRVKYVFTLCTRGVSRKRADPKSDYFDPLRAAILFKRQGKLDEAFWLTFLSVHFGKNLRTGWSLARNIYGGSMETGHWTWERTSSNIEAFRQWLADSYPILKARRLSGSFGNHRKYRTLDPASPKSTGAVIESYVNWVGPERSHESLITRAQAEAGNSARAMFDYLYRSMSEVIDFGRLAKFDFLTMIAKLGLAEIEPGSTYLQGSTGPTRGARLLFGASLNADIGYSALEKHLGDLEAYLSLGEMGMQVLEDGLCNWQKCPDSYRLFRG